MYIGKIIKQYREENHLSLREFAQKCNLSYTYISALEKNKDYRSGKPISPTIETVISVAKGLDISIDELLSKLSPEQTFTVNTKPKIIKYTCKDDANLPILGKGDIAYVEQKDNFETNEIILFILNGEKMIRRVIKTKKYIELLSINPQYASQKFTIDEFSKLDFTLIGKVIKVENSSYFE